MFHLQKKDVKKRKKTVSWNLLCEFEGLLSNWAKASWILRWNHSQRAPLRFLAITIEHHRCFKWIQLVLPRPGGKDSPSIHHQKGLLFEDKTTGDFCWRKNWRSGGRVFFNPWQAQILWQTSRIIDGIMNYTTIQIPIVGYRCFWGKLWACRVVGFWNTGFWRGWGWWVDMKKLNMIKYAYYILCVM